MATETLHSEAAPSQERTVVSGIPARISWGAIFAGAFATIGIWATLYAFGLATGLSSVNPDHPGSIRASGIFTGIWSLVSPWIALFIGGIVAGRAAGPVTKGGGALHGFVMWGLTTVAGAWLLANLLGALVGGIASAGKAAAQAGGGALAGVARQVGNAPQVAQSFGLNANDALKPVNDRLRAEGKPAVSADQLKAAAGDSVRDAVREGRFNRELLVSNLAQNTALSKQDAEEIAQRVENQFNQAKEQTGAAISQATKTVETQALRAADATGKIFWGAFVALILGMVSALLGALVGVSKRQRSWAEQTTLRWDTAGPGPLFTPTPQRR
jgi:hypothetical protein